jgi:hypothetical protein
MKHLILLLALWLATPALANADKDVTASYVTRDFSQIIMPTRPFLGFVGEDYQRLFIAFKSVAQDRQRPTAYFISGDIKTAGVEDTFKGKLTVVRIDQFAKMHFGVDNLYKNTGIKAQGRLYATYVLSTKSGGSFLGEMTLNWYVDANNSLRYDRIESDSDKYANNQYVGRWYANPSSVSQTANWGEYRIPQSGDLDKGAAEFSANPKYKTNGW